LVQPFSVETTLAGRRLSIETGKVAQQADAEVIVRYGDTVILVTVCVAAQPREGVDFLPLTIDYEERLYAAGKIPGGFIRREGRPSEEAVLTSRLTDRPLRPLLPKAWRREIQVITTVLAADRENDPDVLSIIGASTVLGMSNVPFDGPVAACHVGYIDGELKLNPILPDMEKSTLDLVVASTKEAVVMLEAASKEVSEDIMRQAIRFGHQANQELIAMEEKVISARGLSKLPAPVVEMNPELRADAERVVAGRMPAALKGPTKTERDPALGAIKSELIAALGEKYSQGDIANIFDKLIRETLRGTILREHRRVSGRALNELRSITCEAGLLPRVHGSALFTRGETQALTITTLGSMREAQELDGIGIAETKRYMHHYNFPPFSTGETKRIGTPGRREIGHGALAERALLPVLPPVTDFPYAIRLVSEVLSSSGSTSMASTCASTLSLMDAGVPIREPVGGISIGLVTGEGGQYALLTDIEGMEDNYGDMDFKVAGTRHGITAIQLDIKTHGLTMEIIDNTLTQAKDARGLILDKMLAAIPAPRAELSPFAPRMYKLHIDPEKIGTVIGPGGKMIRSITESTGTTIDIENDGTVVVGSADGAAAQKAIEMINNLTREIKVGEIFNGKVVRIMSFGAFVELLPGKDGMVHISELSDHRVDKVEDVVKIGDEIKVKVIEIDNQGRVNLSHRVLMVPEGTEAPPPAPRPPRHDGGGRPGGGPPRYDRPR
jgi:polyribonucleotide nucleotidyltransferase